LIAQLAAKMLSLEIQSLRPQLQQQAEYPIQHMHKTTSEELYTTGKSAEGQNHAAPHIQAAICEFPASTNWPSDHIIRMTFNVQFGTTLQATGYISVHAMEILQWNRAGLLNGFLEFLVSRCVKVQFQNLWVKRMAQDSSPICNRDAEGCSCSPGGLNTFGPQQHDENGHQQKV